MTGGKKTRSLRAAMPLTAEWIDALRDSGWTSDVDAALRNAVAGGTDFYAVEGGHIVGNRPLPSAFVITLNTLWLQPRKMHTERTDS